MNPNPKIILQNYSEEIFPNDNKNPRNHGPTIPGTCQKKAKLAALESILSPSPPSSEAFVALRG